MSEQERQHSDGTSEPSHSYSKMRFKKLYLISLAAVIALVVAGDGIWQRREHETTVKNGPKLQRSPVSPS